MRLTQNADLDARTRRRREAGVGATVRREDGRPLAASVSDLSDTGCRIETAAGEVALDDEVVIRPLGMEALAGRVRWVHEKSAGIEFASKLHPAVVDHLTGDDPLEGAPSPVRAHGSGFTDNFGRSLPALGAKRRV